MVAKHIGRPFKPAIGAPGVALGLKVPGETKRMAETLARASGRSQSQQAEYLIERALQYDQIAKAMGTTLESFEQDSIEAALRRKRLAPRSRIRGHDKIGATAYANLDKKGT